MVPDATRRAIDGAPLLLLSSLLAACPVTVERGLPSCERGPVDNREAVDCERVPVLCDLPVTSEPDPGGDPVDVVFVEAGGLRAGDFRRVVEELMEDRRGDPTSIVGRDPQLFRVHVVDVPPPPAWGTNPLPACVDLASHLVEVPLSRVELAAANAPAADVVVVMTPEVGTWIRESAIGSIALVVQGGDPRVFEHELGHALIGLGDEYSERNLCCADDASPGSTTFVVGDGGLSYFPNLTTDASATIWQGLAAATEGGDRCSRCVFHPDVPCTMQSSGIAQFCPVCERAIEARLHRHAPDRHEDRLPPLCALQVDGDAPPARGDDVDGLARGTLVDEPIALSLTVDGQERVLETGLGMAAFHVPGAWTRDAMRAELVLRCSRHGQEVTRTLAFR